MVGVVEAVSVVGAVVADATRPFRVKQGLDGRHGMFPEPQMSGCRPWLSTLDKGFLSGGEQWVDMPVG